MSDERGSSSWWRASSSGYFLPSFLSALSAFNYTQTMKPESGDLKDNPTSRTRQACDSPRLTGYIMRSSSQDERSETPFSSVLDGETPEEGLTIRVPVPHGNRYPDGWSGSALAGCGLLYDGRSIQANASTRTALQVIRCRRICG